MKLRPLIIDEPIRARINEMVQYARGHHYVPGRVLPPGDDPHFVLVTQFGYRAVFSLTLLPSGLYRHLSVSVLPRVEGLLPNPAGVFELAKLFGFPDVGNPFEPEIPPEMGVKIDKEENCIALVIPVERGTMLP
jgi:hypothetical protein